MAPEGQGTTETLRRQRLTGARSAVLGTVRPDGDPHLVPCCFVFSEEPDTIYSAIDGKPKSTTALQRLANIEANPTASLLIDHFEEDWSALWWVRVDGDARVISTGPEYATAIDRLAEKYQQYRDARPDGAVVVIDVNRWRSWSAS